VFIKIGIERGILRSVDDLNPTPTTGRKKAHAKMPAAGH
jgi:hypothetical protein